VTRLDAGKVALFVCQQRDQLTRIWRLARAEARPGVFPGLLDGVVEGFFDVVAEQLDASAPPEAPWQALRGVVRWPPPLAPGELTEEWSVLREVLGAACESVNAAPAVAAWLAAAVAACEAGTAALADDRAGGPPGIVTALVYSSVEPRQPRPEDAPPA
jgi:hypothetical protein